MDNLENDLLKQVKKEYDQIKNETRKKEMYARRDYYKYFPKIQIVDNVIFTASGYGKKRMIPYWHDII